MQEEQNEEQRSMRRRRRRRKKKKEGEKEEKEGLTRQTIPHLLSRLLFLTIHNSERNSC